MCDPLRWLCVCHNNHTPSMLIRPNIPFAEKERRNQIIIWLQRFVNMDDIECGSKQIGFARKKRCFTATRIVYMILCPWNVIGIVCICEFFPLLIIEHHLKKKRKKRAKIHRFIAMKPVDRRRKTSSFHKMAFRVGNNAQIV